MEYTPCQEKAKEDLQSFLLNPEADVIILSAPAGRGKSFLIENELSNPTEVNEYARMLDLPEVSGVKMAAMSNKAAQVIKGVTFDSLYGLFPKPNFTTGGTVRTRKGGNGNPQFNKVIALDEAGMLDSDGLRHMGELSHNCKVILSCDQYQLGPIGEAYSPIFDAGIEIIEMHTPVRQSEGSPLLMQCDALREGVKNQVLMPLVESDEVIFVNDDQAEHFFANMTPNDKVLTYTNELAIRLNQVVRNLKGVSGFWKVGERLVSNGIIKQGTTVVVSNEQEMTITEVGDHVINEYGLDCVQVYTDIGGFNVPTDPNQLSQLLNKLRRAKDWHTYYAVKETVPDFRGTWSSTVHKSQGSTYGDVFINLNNLQKAKWQDKNLFLRLLYVAVSRAKGRVLLYGQL
ncbi:Dda-like helicase [Vibrio phage D292]